MLNHLVNVAEPHLDAPSNAPQGETAQQPSPASFARSSTECQREASIAAQQKECREAAESHGSSISPELEFTDDMLAGGRRAPDGLKALLAAVRAGHVSGVYVSSLNRFGRNSAIALSVVAELVHNHGLRVVAINDGIDTAQDNWELVTAALATRYAT
jgi:site-specific DNA recombinase